LQSHLLSCSGLPLLQLGGIVMGSNSNSFTLKVAFVFINFD